MEFEDIRRYFADHLNQKLDDDPLCFDINNPTTLDREKHNLNEMLSLSG